jgi:hypothetical protein
MELTRLWRISLCYDKDPWLRLGVFCLFAKADHADAGSFSMIGGILEEEVTRWTSQLWTT